MAVSEGGRAAIISIGGLLIVSGVFLLLWARYQRCLSVEGTCPRPLKVGWIVLAVGAAIVVGALFLPTGPAPSLPEFLRRRG
jgi:hypothetical protein